MDHHRSAPNQFGHCGTNPSRYLIVLVINSDILVLHNNDNEIMGICKGSRPDKAVDRCTGHTGLRLSLRGRFTEQMAASVGKVEWQLTANDLICEGRLCPSL